jgi:hypothetical protein
MLAGSLNRRGRQTLGLRAGGFSVGGNLGTHAKRSRVFESGELVAGQAGASRNAICQRIAPDLRTIVARLSTRYQICSRSQHNSQHSHRSEKLRNPPICLLTGDRGQAPMSAGRSCPPLAGSPRRRRRFSCPGGASSPSHRRVLAPCGNPKKNKKNTDHYVCCSPLPLIEGERTERIRPSISNLWCPEQKLAQDSQCITPLFA